MEDSTIFLGKTPHGLPRQVTAGELAKRLYGPHWLTIDQLKSEYRISERRWPEIARKIAGPYKELHRRAAGEDVLNHDVNERLRDFALAFPPYGTRPQLRSIADELDRPCPAISTLTEQISAIVMGASTRARFLVGRYSKLPLTEEFAYLIDSAYFAFARGNIPASFLTILPVVEGILLRWQGHQDPSKRAPSVPTSIAWVRNTPDRQPILANPIFAESWSETCARILEEHLFKNTTSGDSFANFNRHLALHSLGDRRYATAENTMRAFLLIDLLSALYLCEHHLGDPIFNVTSAEETPIADAYKAAMAPLLDLRNPPPEVRLWEHTRRTSSL